MSFISRNLSFCYEGVGFRSFNVFHTGHSFSSKPKLISPIIDTENGEFLKHTVVVKGKFENFLWRVVGRHKASFRGNHNYYLKLITIIVLFNVRL